MFLYLKDNFQNMIIETIKAGNSKTLERNKLLNKRALDWGGSNALVVYISRLKPKPDSIHLYLRKLNFRTTNQLGFPK